MTSRRFLLLAVAAGCIAGAVGAGAPGRAALAEPAPKGATSATQEPGGLAPASAPIPLTKPGQAPGAASAKSDAEPREAPALDEAEEAGATEDEQSFAACTAELRRLGVAFERIPPLEGEAGCGATHPLKVSAVGSTEIRPAAEMRCPVARSLALWVDRVVAPLTALYLDEQLAAVIVGTDYQCRGRRGGALNRISEHAFANALDVHGFAFRSGNAMPIEVRAG